MNNELSVVSEKRILNLGWISYWNLLPLSIELLKEKDLTIHQLAGHPTQVNEWLRQGRVDIAPCSSVNLLLEPQIDIALPLGVVSDGAVKSVYLGFNKINTKLCDYIAQRQKEISYLFENAFAQFGLDLNKIAEYINSQSRNFNQRESEFAPRIKFSNASATSVALSKIFYKLCFGEEAYEKYCKFEFDGDGCDLELVIGDSALVREKQFTKILDLGVVWKEWTNLPFVFAVWQSQGKSLHDFESFILSAASKAEKFMEIEPQVYYPKELPVDTSGYEISLSDYWRCIYYRLGMSEFKSLLLFLQLYLQIDREVKDRQYNFAKLERWQRKWLGN